MKKEKPDDDAGVEFNINSDVQSGFGCLLIATAAAILLWACSGFPGIAR